MQGAAVVDTASRPAPAATPGAMEAMRPDSGEQATLASHDAHAATPEPEQVTQEAHALAAEFEALCVEFTSPDHAREYGTDWDREAGGASTSSDSENQGAPKKGSLRVFAQQARFHLPLRSDNRAPRILSSASGSWRPQTPSRSGLQYHKEAGCAAGSEQGV